MSFSSDSAAAAGRKSSRKGKPNKTTQEIREIFQSIVSSKSGDIEKWIDKVAKDNPAKACELYFQLSKFTVPTLRSVETKDVTSIEEFLQMTSEERKKRIEEIQQTINNN